MTHYPTAIFKLQLSENFDQLHVLRMEDDSCTVEDSYSTTNSLKVSFGNGAYSISTEVCTGCHVQSYDSDSNDTLTFEGSRMVGVTLVRIEGKVHRKETRTYHLASCGAYLVFNGGSLQVGTATDPSGHGPLPSCVSVEIEEPVEA